MPVVSLADCHSEALDMASWEQLFTSHETDPGWALLGHQIHPGVSEALSYKWITGHVTPC